jgi:4-amino-4-deoxy-L-arabinose transferase-like glycosyltransferase
MKKYFLILILILSTAAFLRLNKLGLIPNGVTNDEAQYIYNSYSIWKTGRDVNGKFLPLSFQFDNSFSPVPIYLTAPFVGILGLSATTGRLPFAIAGIISVLCLYLIVESLTHNQRLALLSAWVMSISPWHIHMSRIAYDCTLALFFSVLGTLILLKSNKIWVVILGMLSFLLSFYSYHATKVFLIIYIPFLFWYLMKFQWKIYTNKFNLLISGLIIFGLILVSFWYVANFQIVTRQNIFLWNKMSTYQVIVDDERTKNTAPQILRTIFTNKITAMIANIRSNYLEAFSSQYLSIYGEVGGLSGIYGVMNHGAQYWFEGILAIFGVCYFLTLRYKNGFIFVIVSLILSPLSASFTVDRSYGARAIMFIPYFSLLIGGGIEYLLNLKQKYNKPVIIGLLSLYVVGFSFYIYQYYYRFPIYDAEGFFYSSKELVNKIISYSGKQVILVNSGDIFAQYVFHTKMDPNQAQIIIRDKSKIYNSNFKLIDGCIDTKGKIIKSISEIIPENTVYIVPADCHATFPTLNVIRDLGEPLRIKWKIYEM